jgi:hypothetical protein
VTRRFEEEDGLTGLQDGMGGFYRKDEKVGKGRRGEATHRLSPSARDIRSPWLIREGWREMVCRSWCRTGEA